MLTFRITFDLESRESRSVVSGHVSQTTVRMDGVDAACLQAHIHDSNECRECVRIMHRPGARTSDTGPRSSERSITSAQRLMLMAPLFAAAGYGNLNINDTARLNFAIALKLQFGVSIIDD